LVGFRVQIVGVRVQSLDHAADRVADQLLLVELADIAGLYLLENLGERAQSFALCASFAPASRPKWVSAANKTPSRRPFAPPNDRFVLKSRATRRCVLPTRFIVRFN
jgi:hypothetical protein